MDKKIKKELVSIMIPCFNAEKTLGRCLDSLLSQSYKKLEIILVNDGSYDGTSEIAEVYRKRFDANGITFIYIEQENKGLGGAINTALKIFSGEYLCWGDADDFWYPESIKIRKEFLDNRPEYGSVSSNAYIFKEDKLNSPIGLASMHARNLDDENQFLNHLTGQPLYCPGCHMVRSDAFLDVNPTRMIYPSRYGQNNQLLMPIYYKYRHKFLDIPLYGYVIIDNSMSHKELSRNEEKERITDYYDSIKYTVNMIDMPVLEKKACLVVNERKRIDSLIDFYAKHHIYSGVYFYRLLKFIMK